MIAASRTLSISERGSLPASIAFAFVPSGAVLTIVRLPRALRSRQATDFRISTRSEKCHPSNRAIRAKEDLPVNNLHCIHLTSVDELRAAASAWDDLWWRSDVALPTVRAELLAQWVEQFKPRGGFHALVVADASSVDRGAAAGLAPRGMADSGGRTAQQSLVALRRIAAGRRRPTPTPRSIVLLAAAAELPWQLLWLNEAVPEAPRWQALLRACQRAGVAASYHERFRVGRVEIDQNWDIYQKRLPKNHRQAMKRALRRLACEGDVQFEMHSRLAVAGGRAVAASGVRGGGSQLEGRGRHVGAPHAGHVPLLRPPGRATGRSGANWKRPPCGSTARCWRSSTDFAPRACTSPTRSATTRASPRSVPGQLLFHHILEQLHGDGDVRALDFMGPLTQSLSRWRPATYGIGRVALAPRRLLGRAAMYAYQHWWRPLRDLKARLRNRDETLSIDDSDDSGTGRDATVSSPGTCLLCAAWHILFA